MEAPRLPKIFKHHGSRGFNYKPMHFDEDKEHREELIRRYEGVAPANKRDSFHSKMKSEWGRSKGKSGGSTNIRLLVIIGVLMAITYLILMS